MTMFDAEAYLNRFTNWEPRLDKAGVSSFSVERMEALLKVFGYPESGITFAHIAGSKGKGSTAAYLANILRASGYRAGLYTSPHLYSCHERIRVLDPDIRRHDLFEGSITSQEFNDLLESRRVVIDRLRASGVEVTYYELLTALAIAYFAMKGVKIAVLETGLGGRLDATNYFETSVCGISPLGLEHTEILGDTLTEIAAEKAAIIKAVSQRAVFAPQPEEAMKVLRARAGSFGIVPTTVGIDMPVEVHEDSIDGVVFSTSGRRPYAKLATQLKGSHQAYNAAVAIAMAEDLEMYGFVLTPEAVRRGVAEALWPGRFEIFPGSPIFVADAAHTPESAAACAGAFARIFPGRKAVLLLGVSRDKNIPGICRALLPVTARVIAARADHPRAHRFSEAELKGYFSAVDVAVFSDVTSARAAAVDLAGAGGIVLAVGSIFWAAQLRPLGGGQDYV